jgi:predicted ABC-type ATPase
MYIIAGPNGSGKSTFAQEFIKEKNLTFVNADIIAQELEPNHLTPRVMYEAGRIFFQRIDQLVKEKSPFVIETTLSGKYTTKLIDRLKRENYRVQMVYVFVETPLLSIERIKIRVLKGGHPVPDVDVKRRFIRSKMNFWNLYRTMVDGWEVYDNSGKVFLPVCIGKGQDYIILDHEMFETFREDLSNGKRDGRRIP